MDEPRLFVALDVPADRTRELVASLPSEAAYKIGLEAYCREGRGLVEWLIGEGHEVFLDLKLHDIPNTVGRATEVVARLGVGYLTVHASGGAEMIRAAGFERVTYRNLTGGIVAIHVAVK